MPDVRDLYGMYGCVVGLVIALITTAYTFIKQHRQHNPFTRTVLGFSFATMVFLAYQTGIYPVSFHLSALEMRIYVILGDLGFFSYMLGYQWLLTQRFRFILQSIAPDVPRTTIILRCIATVLFVVVVLSDVALALSTEWLLVFYVAQATFLIDAVLLEVTVTCASSPPSVTAPPPSSGAQARKQRSDPTTDLPRKRTI